MSKFQALSDAQWSMIVDMLPRPAGRKDSRPFGDARTMVEATIYRCRAGIAWPICPKPLVPGARSGPGTEVWPSTLPWGGRWSV